MLKDARSVKLRNSCQILTWLGGIGQGFNVNVVGPCESEFSVLFGASFRLMQALLKKQEAAYGADGFGRPLCHDYCVTACMLWLV